jgi:hypothetical protein
LVRLAASSLRLVASLGGVWLLRRCVEPLCHDYLIH